MAVKYYEADGIVSGYDTLKAKVLWTNKKGSFLEATDGEHLLYGFCNSLFDSQSQLLVSIIKAFDNNKSTDNIQGNIYLFRPESVVFSY
ncbi:MAG: hypothetical protein E7608_01755 [Ruminococcaceae bacterium]|nr:hypothetical protein [Oscillospiraceae bacterium]